MITLYFDIDIFGLCLLFHSYPSNSLFVEDFAFINLFIYFWLRWVFVAAHGLSIVAARGGYSLHNCEWCAGFSLRWLL